MFMLKVTFANITERLLCNVLVHFVIAATIHRRFPLAKRWISETPDKIHSHKSIMVNNSSKKKTLKQTRNQSRVAALFGIATR